MSRSITPAPSGSLSPDFITVPSSTGFSAGDYVYQKNGDFGVPVSPGTANFNISPTSPIYGATVGGNSTPVNWYGFGSPAQGGSVGQCAAKLSNGNIVIGYRDVSSGQPYFRIVDTDNVQVVAPTSVTGSIDSPANGNIGVIALVGGGFVIHWSALTGGKPAYGVYTNTGTVTTVASIDSTFPTAMSSGKPLAGCALPNGGFALAAIGATAVNMYTRAYNSTGVGAYSWTTVGAALAAGVVASIAARSDSSTCILWTNSASQMIYSILNSSGGSIVGSTGISVSNGPYTASVACLSDDTFVLAFSDNASAVTPRFYLLPVGNVLSAKFSVPITNMAVGTPGAEEMSTFVKELSSGGFVYLTTDMGGGLFYTFYNSAGTALYSVPKVCADINCYTAIRGYIGMVEIANYLSLYHCGEWGLSGTFITYDLYNTKINLTDYSLLATLTTTTPVGTVSTNAGTYARATSLPMKAAYLAANTETLSLNQTISTGSNYTLAPSVVSGSTVSNIKSTTLPDGRFAIVYKTLSAGAISFNVYSIAGVLQTTVDVGTGGTSSGYPVRIAALSSGKIAVAYLDSSNANIVLNVYSTGYALLGTANMATTGNGLFDIAGTKDDRVAICYQNSANTNVLFSVYSNAAALIYGPDTVAAGSANFTVGAGVSENGTIWVTFWGSSLGSNSYWYRPSSATAYLKSSAIAHTNNFNTSSTCPMAVGPTNIVAITSASAATQGSFATLTVNGTAAQSRAPTTFGTSFTGGNSAVGITGAGTFVYFGAGNASGNLYGFTGTWALSSATSAAYGLLSGISPATSNMQACITPSYGYNAVIAWINSSNFAQYAIVNAYPFSATQAITAGVTGSAPTTPLNISQSSGYFLAGVAVSDCPAGGTGQIQTNGVANLGSQYSTTTAFQGFDFQNPVTVGVKGTAVGRTVTMIKD